MINGYEIFKAYADAALKEYENKRNVFVYKKLATFETSEEVFLHETSEYMIYEMIDNVKKVIVNNMFYDNKLIWFYKEGINSIKIVVYVV